MKNNNIPEHETGWKHNLQKPNDPAPSIDQILRIRTNHYNNTYLEYSRSTCQVRGIGITITAGYIILLTMGLSPFIFRAIESEWPIGLDITFVGLTLTLIIGYSFSAYFRMDIEMPRDEPIRFNRARQKVYFYEYRHNLFKTFSRKLWGVKPVAYDWKNLTAEAYSLYAPMGYGGLIESVKIAVHDPDTGQIIDRLFFSQGIQLGTDRWEAVRLYMQRRDVGSVEFGPPPYGIDLVDHPNPFIRIAPKVQWPADMDLESRTAPSSEEKS